MWKRFNLRRQWLNTGLLLAFFLFSNIAQAATLDFTTRSWNRFVQQNKAAIVVFTSTDCSHCPAVVEALHQQLQNAQILAVVGMLLGAGAAVGAATSRGAIGNDGAGVMGAILGPQEMVRRSLLSYQRSEEQAA
ncbi:hypothetical protein, partial [Undibacterium luofuense]|uniref:hypothetical protein n=1 Tax=Undibacterium luofuense TaxID=2828733 RepID=UPI0030ECD394